jgi:SPP1 gp7 family putative phage head morphogenesis protein
MFKYWIDRLARAQTAITNKNLKQIEKQLTKYYRSVATDVIKEFEATYDKILARQAEGKEITPADLYKLDRYWQLQAQTRNELQRLGERQVVALTKTFERNFFEIYYSFAPEGMKAFNTLDKASVTQMIQQIWVADGKTFSQRVWDNTERLMETLNEQLLLCATTGKKTTELKKALQERFGVSYHRADTLARTELVHIQTQAAKQRYMDYGIEYVEVLVDSDARTCDLCKELIGKKFRTTDTPPLPVHPNERCCLVPVID